jgi:DNA replication protein DnaC
VPSVNLSYRGFLAELLMGECEDRDRRRSERRMRAAGFPRPKWLSDFAYTANRNVTPALINNLATCEWVKKGEPLCSTGDSGTGTSHLLIGLGSAAFGGWTKTFTDPRLCAAIVDRLTFNGTIIETGTESYRLAQTKAQTKARQQQTKK